MKLHQLAKGKAAVKEIPFRAANAPPTDGEDGHTVKTGARILTGGEVAQVYQDALERAKASGVTEWLDSHPLCRLYEMAHTVAVAYVDIDSGERLEPFFTSVDEVLSSPLVGSDNIAYLYQQHQAWQDECSFSERDFKLEEVIALIAQEAERPENSHSSPFSRLRPSSQESLWHSTCVLLRNLLQGKLAIGSAIVSPTSSAPSETESNAAKSE